MAFFPGFTFFDRKSPFLKGFLLSLKPAVSLVLKNAGPIGTEMAPPKMSGKVSLLLVPSIFHVCSI